jgi:hypothetical protein
VYHNKVIKSKDRAIRWIPRPGTNHRPERVHHSSLVHA